MRPPAAALVAQLYQNLCGRCLARELGVPPVRAIDLGRDLARGKGFVREWAMCNCCREHDVVVRHVPTTPLAAIAF